jgi:two-component system chemotaxis response regulator CheB
VLVVLHIGSQRSNLPAILGLAGPLPAVHPSDGETLAPGMIYVAPPDHHLLVEPGRLQLFKGPKEHHVRPAIDPLFRSAALAYGPAVTGVILSGNLNDGAEGLKEVKRRGGVAIVQDPRTADYPSMPLAACKRVAVDHVVPVWRIATLLSMTAAGGQGPPSH